MRFYRFRSMKSLLGDHKELEKQSIYFAAREQLNDPMEGFRNFFWHGDAIIWRNLFRHYLLSLDRTYVLYLTSGDENADLWKQPIPVRESLAQLPAAYCARFERVQNAFFGMPAVDKLIVGLIASGRKVRRDELRFYLQYLHYSALEACLAVATEEGFIPRRDHGLPRPRDLLESAGGRNFFTALSQLPPAPGAVEEGAEIIFQIAARMQAQSELIHRYNKVIDPADHNKHLIVLDFPDRYLRATETLVFPTWYTACFMSECTNSSVWGNYGVNHTGACLIFDSRDVNGRPCLPMTGFNSMGGSGPLKGPMDLAFEQVRYDEGYAKLDFFRLLGRVSRPMVELMWYRDPQGNYSDCAKPLLEDEEGWKKQYWQAFRADVLRKSKDWAYENEHRLVLHGSVVDYTVDAHRILTYEFSALHGVIFGINTPMEDRVEIVRILLEKCAREKRSDFAFYQAHYSPTSGTIEHAPLRLLKRKES